ncbi:unnamed protein product [Heligmosomoides polygyrus]|uniref:FLYWCH-type domain-containing protein n=1 Tax=Heligmosomoides polygyrus TaxID=6339 RepID=A0A183G1V4_HELPZ|nr:unnamed protein product [Heligmosomoides polygyrus]
MSPDRRSPRLLFASRSLDMKVIVQDEEENGLSTRPGSKESSKSGWIEIQGLHEKHRPRHWRLLKFRAANGQKGTWRGCERILFTDEKLFTVEQAHNRKNDRIWSAEAPSTSSIVEHRQNPQSVMVWGGISVSGKTPLVFVDKSVKIDKDVHQ